MADKPTIADLLAAADISQSYASMILNGDRAPSRPLAIRLFRKTGWKHPVIAALGDAEIDVLEGIDPWSPRIPASAA